MILVYLSFVLMFIAILMMGFGMSVGFVPFYSSLMFYAWWVLKDE